MNTRISFEEMAKLGKEILDSQGPITYEEAKAQVERIKRCSIAQRFSAPVLQTGNLSSTLSGAT